MLISRWIDKLSGRQRMLDDLINRITARCVPVVWGRVYPTAVAMDAAQARGYIRARAARVISLELQIAVNSLPRLSPALQTQLKRSVAEKLVCQMVAEISARHHPHVANRRAA